MGIAYFQKGVEVEINGQPFQLKRKISENVWQAEKSRTGQIQDFSVTELQRLFSDSKLVFMKDAKPNDAEHKPDSSNIVAMRPEVPPEQWEKAKIHRAYVKAVEDLPATEGLISTAIMNVWNTLKQPPKAPHWITVARWKAKYDKNGKDANALVEENHKKGNRQSRYPEEVINIVNASIENIYMARERRTVADTHAHAMVQVERKNAQLPSLLQLPRPTRRLIERCLKAYSAYDLYVSRYGQVAATRKFRGKTNHRISHHALESAEIDHTQLDVFVIDESGVPMGRPWITICIDVHTRCVLGIYIGFEPPSYLSVARCLKHAFLPKADLQEIYPEIKLPWEAHGVMETIRVDNGLEFHSYAFEQVCHSFGIDIEYMPRKQAWLKGIIERFNKTLNDSTCHGIPGTSFSNIFEKDDYDPAKHAILTLPKLRLIIHKWIADCYHHRPHKSLENITPAKMWDMSISDEDIPLPEDPARIDVLLGKSDTCTLTHKGIEINSLFYNSHDLIQVRRRHDDKLKVEIRIDEGNVGHIFVLLPGSTDYLKVPAIHSEYAEGVSLWQHKLFKKYAKLHDQSNDHIGWALAKVEIMEIVQGEVKLKKGRRKTVTRQGRHQEVSRNAQPAVSIPAEEDPIILQKRPRVKSPSRFTTIIENRAK